jgi:imidazolonepropionase-like amidohydrolase
VVRSRPVPHHSTVTLSSLVAGALLLAAAAQAHAQAAPPETLVFTHAVLITGTGAAPVSGQTIVVTRGRISDVFPDGAKRLPSGRMLDLTGRFLVPGFIDAHVHVATDPTGRDANAIEQLRGALRGGVTSVRDMAGDAIVLGELAVAARNNEAELPRIFYSVVLAGPTFFEDPRTRTAAHGGTPGEVPWMRAITNSSDLAAVVADAKRTGATGLKLYADLAPDLVARVAREAHAQGLRVWSHATIYPSRPSDAVAGGVDVISHSLLLYWQGARDVPERYHARAANSVYDSLPVRGPTMDSLFRHMRDKGTVLDATLFVSSRLESAPAGTAGMADPRRAVLWMYDVTRVAREHDVTVAAGTDGMMPGATTELPNLHREMELLVTRAGFTPLEAITAATLNSARAIGVDSIVGTIAVGKLADMVILMADPTADIRHTREIEYVVKGGHVFAQRPDR